MYMTKSQTMLQHMARAGRFSRGQTVNIFMGGHICRFGLQIIIYPLLVYDYYISHQQHSLLSTKTPALPGFTDPQMCGKGK